MAKLIIVAELTANGHKSTHTYVSSTTNKSKQDAVAYVDHIVNNLIKPFNMKGASVHCDINLQTDNMWVRRLRYSNGVVVITNATLV